jgi:hypothetical protein
LVDRSSTRSRTDIWRNTQHIDHTCPACHVDKSRRSLTTRHCHAVGLRPSLDRDAYFDAPGQDKEARKMSQNNRG